MKKESLVHIRIEPVKGRGAISHTLMRTKASGQGSMPPEEDHLPTIHPTMKHLVEHIKTVMMPCFPSKDGAENEEKE